MKPKTSQNKERNTIAKQSQLSSLNSSMIKIINKQSKHTKLSSTLSSPSLHVNAANKKSTKQKKTIPEETQKKQRTIRNTQLVTSGRTKTLKLKIKNKKSCDFQIQKSYQSSQDGSVSYREYCLVEDLFVPIVSKNQHKKLEDILRSTADTTNRFEDFNRTTFRNVFPFKLKQSSSSVSRVSEAEENIFKKSRKVSKRQVEIDASPFYEEIGIQYSERPEFINPPVLKEQVKMQAVQIDIQTDSITHLQSPVKMLSSITPKKQQQEEQTLSDLLLKLQFKHLPNEKNFQNLSKNQKQHYSQLLNSLISKLNCSPRQKEVSPIKTKQMIEIQDVKFMPLEEIKIKYEKLEMEILKRQSYQMNWMQRRMLCNEDENGFDTSMMAVTSFLLNFFCYIELNYLDDFLNNIKKQYGPSYSAEFQRVSRKLQLQTKTFKVLDQSIFQEFCVQLSQVTNEEKTHLKAVFDYINDLLDTYRPYYQHKGEPFPWAMKVYNNICEYVIDQGSLEIIFIQVKENIERSVAMLCGLIVDESLHKDISEVNPLTLKRTQKQNLLVNDWMVEKSQENHSIQCQGTAVLAEVSDKIYNMLLLEILNEIPLSHNSIY